MHTSFFRISVITCVMATVLALHASPVMAVDPDEELAKKTQNPVANLISLPFQSNWDFDIGPKEDKQSFLLNVQPVIPFSLGENYNLITRTR